MLTTMMRYQHVLVSCLTAYFYWFLVYSVNICFCQLALIYRDEWSHIVSLPFKIESDLFCFHKIHLLFILPSFTLRHSSLPPRLTAAKIIQSNYTLNSVKLTNVPIAGNTFKYLGNVNSYHKLWLIYDIWGEIVNNFKGSAMINCCDGNFVITFCYF